MNKVCLIGRITKDPELRYTSSNIPSVRFTLAVNRKYTKPGEERQADFINIVAWNKLADFAEKYLKQGTQICVAGRIQTRNWEDNNGNKRYATEIIAEEIDFADSAKKVDESILFGTTKSNNESVDTTQDSKFISNGDDLPF